MTEGRRAAPGMVVFLLLAAVSCGGGGTGDDGLLRGDGEAELFGRASQLYFRGSLSRAREEFNVFLDRFPSSPLIAEAGLALRRIEQDLGGTQPDTAVSVSPTRSPVAVVSLPANAPRLGRIAGALQARGFTVVTAQDEGAPNITVVLYPEGLDDEASLVADSLEGWLTSPATVPVQPGGGITSSIVPGHTGVVVVIGTDAVVSPTAPAPVQSQPLL
ncbi:LytR C-terminal domain-containing protein [Candidatus Fermentibacteria bacterium]|nr:LytR C-terminal domain-containing protein [Candidatus Fermentibacteria bacterium]